MHKPEGKTSFSEGTKAFWAGWAKRGGGGLRGNVGRLGSVGPSGPDPKRRLK
jgi:hypothetical protein